VTSAERLADLGLAIPPYVEHLDGCASVKQWARHVGISRSEMRKRFLRKGFRNPSTYLRLIRLADALDGLEPDAPFYTSVGDYSDVFCVSNACKSLLGVRPSALRSRDWREVVRERFAA
jgi:AraC-like DNA-binding protein